MGKTVYIITYLDDMTKYVTNKKKAIEFLRNQGVITDLPYDFQKIGKFEIEKALTI